MSLDYNLSKVKDYQSVCYAADGEIAPATKSLVFSTLAIGMPELTKGNRVTFLRRLNLWEAAHGFPLTSEGTVAAHIGMKTNAAPCSKGRFITRMKTIMFEKLPVELRRGL